MCVIVQRHGDVGVPHDVLQRFRVHPRICQARTERMPQGMGRDVGKGFFRLALLVVLLDKPSQHTFVTGLYFGITVAVKEQEILVAVDIDRRCLPPVLHRPPQRFVDFAAHGDLPCAVFGFRRVHIIADLTVFEKLVVHIDLPALEIKVGRQAAELGNAEAGPQENDDLVTILLVDRIGSRKSEKAVLLLLGQSDLFLRVILQDRIVRRGRATFPLRSWSCRKP